MKRLRVLIANASPGERALLRQLLAADPAIVVAGEAVNGRQAVEMTRSLLPDLLLMGLHLPVMTGLQAIEEIMCHKALPILAISSDNDTGFVPTAMERGALEVLGINECQNGAMDLPARVRLLAGVTVVTRRKRSTPPPLPVPPSIALPLMPDPTALRYPRLFAIAASTGGPQALAKILPALPADFPAPVVVAQHLSDGFAQGIADWLDSLCRLRVRLAAEGEFPTAGEIHIVSSEAHCILTPARRYTCVARSPLDIYHPSCDLLLESAGEILGHRAVGIILTGMGQDGARGMARIHARGGVTLAQDEATSLIYGMNAAAIQTGVVQRVLPLEAIAGEMIRLAGEQA
ncbi:MAG: response regulator [Magnetococcales bacterium]|nr:response regulator [Magnetococcales bacterium]